jgi:hypothetical protein
MAHEQEAGSRGSLIDQASADCQFDLCWIEASAAAVDNALQTARDFADFLPRLHGIGKGAPNTRVSEVPPHEVKSH